MEMGARREGEEGVSLALPKGGAGATLGSGIGDPEDGGLV